jgi:argininosuccinate synthase
MPVAITSSSFSNGTSCAENGEIQDETEIIHEKKVEQNEVGLPFDTVPKYYLTPRSKKTTLPNPEMMAKLNSRPDLQAKVMELYERDLVNPYGAKIVGGLLSGGVDTSFIPLILSRFFSIEVQSLTLNFGGICNDGVADDARNICENLSMFGVSDPKFKDMREELGEYFIPLLMGDVIVPGSPGIFPNSSLSRILMVKALAQELPEAQVYLTGAAKNQNNNLRFMTAAYEYLDNKPLWSPIFSWEEIFKRQDCLDVIRLCTGQDLSTRCNKDDPCTSGDETFLKKEEEDGNRSRLEYDFPVQIPMTLPPRTVLLNFEEGRPVAIDGQRLNFVKLVGELNKVGLEYGLPWKASVESRPTGKGEIEWNLTPGVDVLREAMCRLRAASVPPRMHQELFRFNAQLAEDILRGGLHNTTTIAYINVIRELCANVTGSVKLTFYPGFVRASQPQPVRPVTVAEAPCGHLSPPENALDSVNALIAHNVVGQAFRTGKQKRDHYNWKINQYTKTV